jgi:cytidylate kinase
MQLKKSERSKAKIKMALQGPSGSGKSMSAILLAQGITNGNLSKVALIDSKTNDPEDIQELLDRISKMRSAGLSREGEFSVENLTFKALRNNGYIQKIRQYQNTAYDNDLSLE